MQIRTVRKDDLPELAEILRASRFKRYDYIRALPKEPQVQYHLLLLEEALPDPRQQVLLAGESEPVAFLRSRFLEWDTEVLGFPCVRIEEIFYREAPYEILFPALLSLLLETLSYWQERLSFRFADLRLDSQMLPAHHAAEEAGFRLVEASLLHAYVHGQQEIPAPDPRAVIRFAEPADRETLLRMTRNLIRHDRFHRDPRFPPDAGHRIYERWLDECLRQQERKIVVLEWEGRIAGFLAGSFNEKFNRFSPRKVGYYDLIVITPNPRFLKAWDSLVGAATRMALQAGFEIGEGRTQVHNIANMLRLQLFPPAAARPEFTFHLWQN